MKTIEFIQFYGLSTGYVMGSVPPKFLEEYKEPIELLGSDGVRQLDRRFSWSNKHEQAMQATKNHRNAIGYKLMGGRSFSDATATSSLILLDGSIYK